MKHIALAVVFLAVVHTSLGAEPGVPTAIVRDINTTNIGGPSDPGGADSRGAVSIGDLVFFAASSHNNGNELWKSDGTAEGTSLVRDINPGPNSADPTWLTDVDGVLFFSAYDGKNHGLWKSDGTPEGTVLVKNIPFNSFSSYPLTQLTDVDGILFFSRFVPRRGTTDLWKSDGTGEGTLLVKQLPFLFFGLIHSSTSFNGTLYFGYRGLAVPGASGLWKSDGTEEGTTLVKGFDRFSNLTDVNGTLFLTSGQPWRSDGTADGTVVINQDVDVIRLPPIDVGGTVYFVGRDEEHGAELWKSDGTDAGTMLVKDIRPGLEGGCCWALGMHDGLPFFVAEDDVHGIGLWKSDGTEAGTEIVKAFGTAYPYAPSSLTSAGDVLWFNFPAPDTGLELWRTDGTAAGTALVKDVYPGAFSSDPNVLGAAGGVTLFAADDGTHDRELWKTDGTGAGTALLKDINTAPGSSQLGELTELDRALFFSRAESRFLYEGRYIYGEPDVWTSDGSSEGTRLLKSPDNVRNRVRIVRLNNRLLISTCSLGCSTPLWTSDGTTAGTVPLNEGTFSQPISQLTPANGTVFFETDGDLWRTDGTDVGTTLVKDGISPGLLTDVDGTLFLMAGGLWKSDGTDAGTVPVSDIAPDGIMRAIGGELFFRASDETTGRELWKSDGTFEGTDLVKDINPGLYSSVPYLRSITDLDGMAMFFADDDITGFELWRSDGTEGGTVLVSDINPYGDSAPLFFFNEGDSTIPNVEPVVMNGTMYFAADDGTSGFELWRSDGTGAGTVLVKDISPGPSSSRPTHLVKIGNVLLFAASTAAEGLELWRSDGTDAGTVRVHDIAPGPGSSSPMSFTVVDDVVFFQADDGTTGPELWAGRLSIMTGQPLLAIQGLLDDVRLLGLQGGLEASLVSKLDAAAGAIRSARGDAGANILEAFVQQVEALSGRQIPDEDAQDLKEFAQQISNLVRGS